MRKHTWLLVALFLLAFAIRLAYWERSASFGKYELSYDDDEYYQLGVLFARGEFFQDPYPLRYTRAPGLPLFLTPIFAAFGTRIEIALFFQIGVSMLLVAVTYVTARRAFGARPGAWAMALMAVAPIFASTAGSFLLTETLFAFCILLFLYLFWRWTDEGMTAGQAMVSGLVLGYGALVRPLAIYFVLFAAQWILYNQWGRWKWAVPRIALVVLGMFLLILPYTLRNYITYERILLIDSTGGWNMWRDHGAPGDNFLETVSSIPNPADRDRYAMQRGLRNILADPVNQIGVQGLNNLAATMRPELDSFARGAGFLNDVMVDAPTLPLVALNDAYYLFVVILGLGGIAVAWQRGEILRRTPLLWWLGFYLLLIVIRHPQARFRAQFAFILIVYAGAALALGLNVWKTMSPRARMGWLAATVLVLALAYSPLLPPLFTSELYLAQAQGRDIEKIRQAISAYPISPKGYDELGDAYRLSGDFENALAAYDAALQLNAFEIQARLGKIDVLRRLGRLEQAAEQVRAAGAASGEYDLPGPLWHSFQAAPTRLVELGDGDSSFGYALNLFAIEPFGDELMRFTRARSFVKFPGVTAWQPRTLTFYARAVPLPNQAPPTTTVYLNGRPAAHIPLTGDWTDYRIPLDETARALDTLVVEFRSPTFRPSDTLEDSTDARELGFMLSYVELSED